MLCVPFVVQEVFRCGPSQGTGSHTGHLEVTESVRKLSYQGSTTEIGQASIAIVIEEHVILSVAQRARRNLYVRTYA